MCERRRISDTLMIIFNYSFLAILNGLNAAFLYKKTNSTFQHQACC